MDKYEYKMRAEEIRGLIREKEYAEAVRIADTIDWRRVKNVSMLCTVSDLYKINRRFEESRDLLLLAYDKRPGSRTIVYSLCELAIKMGDVVQAVEYYKEYVQVAQNDTGRYILQYKLYEAQEVSLEERIEVLEEFKKRDYREKWGYELAYLYHRIGLETKCVEECDQLILWFGKGRYVIKAMELKMLHEPLTTEQEIKYRELKGGVRPKPRQEQVMVPEDELPIEIKQQDLTNAPTTELPSKELDIQVKPMNVGQYDTINLQKALEEGMKEFFSDQEQGMAEAGQMMPEQMPEVEQPMDAGSDVGGDTIVYTPVGEEVVQSLETDGNIGAGTGIESQEVTTVSQDIPEGMTQEQEVFGMEESAVADEMRPVAPELMEQPAEEIFFEDVTSEMPQVEEAAEPEKVTQVSERTEMDPARLEPSGEMRELEFAVSEEKEEVEAETVAEETTEEETSVSGVRQLELNPEIAQMLSQEYDGQISLVVPEQTQIEKQITGQLSIEDVLAEWERMKKENEQKRAEANKQRVLQQTGALFSEYDEEKVKEVLEEAAKASDFEAEMVDKLVEEPEAEIPEEEVEEPEAEIPEEEVEEPEAETLEEEAEEPEAEISEEEIEEPEAEIPEEEVEEPEAETLEEEAEEPEAEISEEEVEEPEAEIPEEEVEEPEPEKPVEKKAQAEPQKKKAEPQEKEVQAEEKTEPSERLLNDEEKDLYGTFIQTKREKNEILSAVDNMSLAPYTGNIIITGDAGVEKIDLAKNLIRELQMSDANFSGKVAKITGKALNKKDMEATLSRIPNGALIIEAAGELKPEALKAMNKALEKDQNGIMIIMEDTKKAIDNMLASYQKISDNFTSRINIEVLNNDALVAYGKRYAKEMEYSIDELGVLALYRKIEGMQTSEHNVTAAEVRDMIDDAIYSASRKNLRHLMELLTGRRYDAEDMIVLKEHDFMLE